MLVTEIVTEVKRLEGTGAASEDPNGPVARWMTACLDMAERLDSATTEEKVGLVALEWHLHKATCPGSSNQ